MSTVMVKDGNVESALRVMKQKNMKDGLQRALRERQEGYLKPGVKKRKAKEEARKNSKKRENKFDRAA